MKRKRTEEDPKRAFVGLDQEALAKGGHRLKMGKIGRPGLQSQSPHTGALCLGYLVGGADIAFIFSI